MKALFREIFISFNPNFYLQVNNFERREQLAKKIERFSRFFLPFFFISSNNDYFLQIKEMFNCSFQNVLYILDCNFIKAEGIECNKKQFST